MEIEKKIDELTIQRWRFIYIMGNIYLNYYVILQKESKRHRNYKTLKLYDRIMTRNNTLTEDQVPLSDDLKAEVMSLFTKNIKVMKWGQRNES